jgi:chromosome segregation protein
VLEDAAGIAACIVAATRPELRLKATEANLARLADLIGQLASQLQALRRQARQAQRYREISGKIRATEALLHHLTWGAACAHVDEEEASFQRALAAVAQETKAEGEALRQQAEDAEKLQPLRDEEAARAAVLHRLSVERDALDREEARAKARHGELETRLAQASRDLAREEEHIAEAEGILRRLGEEKRRLEAASSRDHEEPQLRAAADKSKAALDADEATLRAATTALAEARAERGQHEGEKSELQARMARLEAQAGEIEAELARGRGRKRDRRKIAGAQCRTGRAVSQRAETRSRASSGGGRGGSGAQC